ncbi:hypothetical protein [Rhizobium sp. HT1-10]|uniref:hypothetical protein n=1 Tax=Rhizobium sp. HT1-10 TaxID=3111638 RepID=UPI003C238E7F
MIDVVPLDQPRATRKPSTARKTPAEEKRTKMPDGQAGLKIIACGKMHAVKQNIEAGAPGIDGIIDTRG